MKEKHDAPEMEAPCQRENSHTRGKTGSQEPVQWSSILTKHQNHLVVELKHLKAQVSLTENLVWQFQGSA